MGRSLLVSIQARLIARFGASLERTRLVEPAALVLIKADGLRVLAPGLGPTLALSTALPASIVRMD